MDGLTLIGGGVAWESLLPTGLSRLLSIFDDFEKYKGSETKSTAIVFFPHPPPPYPTTRPLHTHTKKMHINTPKMPTL